MRALVHLDCMLCGEQSVGMVVKQHSGSPVHAVSDHDCHDPYAVRMMQDNEDSESCAISYRY